MIILLVAPAHFSGSSYNVSSLTLVPKAVLLVAVCAGSVVACGGEPEQADDSVAGQAPDSFVVALNTSGGEIRIRMHRAWSPLAVDRVYELVQTGFYDGARFYRVNDQYVQFGFSGRPERDTVWFDRRLPDEPVRASNVGGAVSFGRAGPGSRNFVLFMNLVDNTFLDEWAGDGVVGFPPVGIVEEGLDVAERFNAEHGDAIVPLEDSILQSGNDFLDRRYPGLDSIVTAEIAHVW
ncbi:MAG: peptidylprolyl isomerase [Gemmatimonadota bacterium]